MYNINLLKTEEVEIKLINNTIYFSCRQYDYCYLDFNHIRKEVTKDNPSAKTFFNRIFEIVRKMELNITAKGTVYTRNWNLARIAIDNVPDAIVLYYDKYSYKIRVNIQETKTDHHFVHKVDSESVLKFITRSVYDEQIRQKIIQLHKLQEEIKQLKNGKIQSENRYYNFSRMFSEQ